MKICIRLIHIVCFSNSYNLLIIVLLYIALETLVNNLEQMSPRLTFHLICQQYRTHQRLDKKCANVTWEIMKTGGV